MDYIGEVLKRKNRYKLEKDGHFNYKGTFVICLEAKFIMFMKKNYSKKMNTC